MNERDRRLFIGIALDEVARTRCAAVAEELRRTGFDARYEAVEKLHVTLAFLGNVAPARYAAVVLALDEAARGAPFDVSLDKIGAFPHERKPRVVYIGAREQGAAFRHLAQSVRSVNERLGFEFKEDPVAHVTIARVKDARRPLRTIEFEPIPLRVTSISIFESLFDGASNTSRYEIVERAPLLGTTEITRR